MGHIELNILTSRKRCVDFFDYQKSGLRIESKEHKMLNHHDGL